MRHVTVQQLSAFLDGALTGVSRDLVTRHLAACPDCRERHALWHIYDEVLQRVLSWEPNERTMEEASARVELTLTAERRGLPPPEFTSVLQPVIASTPDPAALPKSSGLFPSLPPLTTAMATAAPPPPPPQARAMPPDLPPAPAATPSAQAFPLDAPGMAPPPPPPPPSPPPPSPPPPPRRYAPPPAPAPGYSPPITVHEDLRHHAPAPVAPWPAGSDLNFPDVQARPSRWRRVLWVGAALLVLVILATPWLPDVIRIRLPESFEPRVPRVEFVRHGPPPAEPPAPLDPTLRLAERTSSAPPPEPWRALPVPVDSTAGAATSQDQASPSADSAALEVPVPVPPPAAVATTAPSKTPRKRPAPVKPAEPEDESGTAAGVQHSMTFVPVQVKTEVRLSSTAPSSSQPSPSSLLPPGAATAAAADTAGDRAMPLLCGEVLDESGAPIEGARVQFTSPPLTIRTDKRGRFCVSCPAGERTFLVDAPGFAAVTRGVELTGPTFETHITLTAIR